jgi:hypothetical protein
MALRCSSSTVENSLHVLGVVGRFAAQRLGNEVAAPADDSPSAQPFRFWLATQAIIVGLAIQAALEQVHANVSPGLAGQKLFSLERTLVYASFTILLIRFYGGALRFGNLEEIRQTTFTEVKNFLGASALFSLFFLMAMSVNDTMLFLKFVLLLHLIDSLWFVATYFHSRRIEARQRQRVSGFFLLLTLASIGLIVLAPALATLWGLVAISALDFLIFWPFYHKCQARFIWEPAQPGGCDD